MGWLDGTIWPVKRAIDIRVAVARQHCSQLQLSVVLGGNRRDEAGENVVNGSSA